MTNDICLKGFWPPEANVTVNKGFLFPFKKKIICDINNAYDVEDYTRRPCQKYPAAGAYPVARG